MFKVKSKETRSFSSVFLLDFEQVNAWWEYSLSSLSEADLGRLQHPR